MRIKNGIMFIFISIITLAIKYISACLILQSTSDFGAYKYTLDLVGEGLLNNIFIVTFILGWIYIIYGEYENIHKNKQN